MTMCAQNPEMKHEFEMDIHDIEEETEELTCVLELTSELMGAITCMVEDRLEDGVPAYEYNGADLPKKTCEYPNGGKYEESVYIWNKDVYFEIEADW